MDLKKAIIHLNCLGRGGAEKVGVTLAAEMVKKGIGVIIATEWTDKVEYPLPEGVIRENVGLSEAEEKYSRLKKINLRKARLKALIERTSPDVVFALGGNLNYRAVSATRGTGVPAVVSVRSDPNVYYASLSQKILSSRYYKTAEGIVFQTESARDFFGPEIAKKSTIIVNPIDKKYIGIKAPEKRRKVIVSASRFVYVKDHMTMVKAFEKTLEKHPDATMELYGGKGADNEIFQVKEWVRSHGLTEKILFMGSSIELEKKLYDASAFVLSSVYEGMPNALMEAMAMGLPCISSDCPPGGPRALIEEGKNGLLFPVGDVDALSKAMVRILDDPKAAEEMGKSAAEKTSAYTAENITNTWIEYAESVIKHKV